MGDRIPTPYLRQQWHHFELNWRARILKSLGPRIFTGLAPSLTLLVAAKTCTPGVIHFPDHGIRIGFT